MTRTTNARVAGTTFLAYIAAGITSMVVFGHVTNGQGVAAKLAGIAQHSTEVGVVAVLGLMQAFAAITLAVTLYSLTREQDPDLSLLGLACRLTEGVIGGVGATRMPELVWLATASGPNAPGAAAPLLGAYLLHGEMAVAATFFAVGSAFFSYLLMRGRMIPAVLAWIGVAASLLLVAGLPLQLAGVLRAPVTSIIWLPMLVYEVPLGVWLIVKGVAGPIQVRAQSATAAR